MTLNGCIRVLTHPSYPALDANTRKIAAFLREICAMPSHRYWPDSVSILDESLFSAAHYTHRSLTDAYLLGLAVHNGGRLVTLDRHIPVRAVRATLQSLLVLD